MQHNLTPQDLRDTWNDLIIPDQSLVDMHSCALTSRAWCQFYNDPLVWKRAIQTHFGFNAEAFGMFEALVGNEKIDYKSIYQRLHKLKKSQHSYYDFSVIFQNTARHLPLLVCCLDNLDIAKKILPRAYNDIWRKVVLTIESVAIFGGMFRGNRDDKYVVMGDLHLALCAGSDNLIQYFIDNELEFIAKEDASTLWKILSRGCLTHVEQLLSNPSLARFELNRSFESLIENRRIPLQYTYELFVRENEKSTEEPLKLVDYVLSHILRRKENEVDAVAADNFIHYLWKNKIGFKPIWGQGPDSNNVRDTICCELVREGYLDYVKYLLIANQVQLPLPSYFIDSLGDSNALTSENLAFFFDKHHSWALLQSTESLEYIIRHNHYEIFIHILDPINGYQFEISSKIFEWAASAEDPRFLQCLLARHTPSSPKPTTWALSLAIRFGRPENLRLLLDPIFEAIPTKDVLREAVNCKLTDAVKMLMDEGRQFGLRFTSDMLKSACEPSNYLQSRKLNMDLINFMLEPRFGLAVTQGFFDELYESSSSIDAYRRSNNIEIFLFLLDNYDVKLTQEKFERLIDYAHLLAMVTLPAIYPDRFSYLKVTTPMLHKAIELKEMAYVEYLMQPFFGLTVDDKTLWRAIHWGDQALAETLQADCSVIPRQGEILELLKKGNANYARKLLSQYDISIDDFFVSQLFKVSSLECLKIALDLAKEKGGLGHEHPYEEYLDYRSLECFELILDPQYHIHIKLNDLGEYQQRDLDQIFKEVPSIEQLVKSDAAIKSALQQLSHQLDASAVFQEAMQLSPTQCFRVSAYALSHREEYSLDALSQEALLTAMVNALEGLDQFSLADLILIKKYLWQAQKMLIGSDELLLANRLPVAEIKEYLDTFMRRESPQRKYL